ncbi:MAG: hypothetical protein HZB50_11165 [Chloroflexi bacterium]|nr:hypothetical protein [Chloroflexota bacterium]
MGQEYDFIRLGEYSTLLCSYSWLEVETYLISNLEEQDYNSEVLFKTLLSHKLYHRSFQTAKALEKPSDIHGPFEIMKLRPDSFKQITLEQFSGKTDELIHSRCELVSKADEIDIARQAETRWLLNKLPKEFADYYELSILREDEKYRHEFWWVLTVFHEFIIVERSTKKLYICVIGSD